MYKWISQKDIIFLSDLWIFQLKFGMADQDDYESLPESAPFKAVATAGACAGVAEHCAMYPFDSVKVKWKKNISGIWQEYLYNEYWCQKKELFQCFYCQNWKVSVVNEKQYSAKTGFHLNVLIIFFCSRLLIRKNTQCFDHTFLRQKLWRKLLYQYFFIRNFNIVL